LSRCVFGRLLTPYERARSQRPRPATVTPICSRPVSTMIGFPTQYIRFAALFRTSERNTATCSLRFSVYSASTHYHFFLFNLTPHLAHPHSRTITRAPSVSATRVPRAEIFGGRNRPTAFPMYATLIRNDSSIRSTVLPVPDSYRYLAAGSS